MIITAMLTAPGDPPGLLPVACAASTATVTRTGTAFSTVRLTATAVVFIFSGISASLKRMEGSEPGAVTAAFGLFAFVRPDRGPVADAGPIGSLPLRRASLTMSKSGGPEAAAPPLGWAWMDDMMEISSSQQDDGLNHQIFPAASITVAVEPQRVSQQAGVKAGGWLQFAAMDWDYIVTLGPWQRYRYFWRHDPLFAPLVILGVPALVWLVIDTWG